jgi:predicted amidohydrolase
MKICIAQTKPIKGDIEDNVADHMKMIDLAISCQAEVIIFTELSLTGYEPTLAHSLALHPQDKRLNVFQKISDNKRITIGVGVPTRNDRGICISMIIFQPLHGRRVYSKKYLHPDEEAFFMHGDNFPVLKVGTLNIAFAICYEISVTQHAEDAFNAGAEIYIASVAKFERGIDAAMNRLSDIARKHSAIVLMANSIGQSDGNICAGKSSVWNREGALMAQLNGHQKGIIIVDLDSEAVAQRSI